MPKDALVNTGAPGLAPAGSGARVSKMQAKLHCWAVADPGRRFGDLFNLVHDPATLMVAWDRVVGNTGARSAGADGRTAVGVEQDLGVQEFLEARRSSFELILVDYGSSDGTAAVIRRAEAEHGYVRPVLLSPNRGKGRALAEGVKEKMAMAGQGGASVEERVSEIWKSSLGVSSVGLDDDFFDLGGTSLALINVVVEMSKRFALPLDTGIVTRGATVRALAEALKERAVAPSAIECLVA